VQVFIETLFSYLGGTVGHFKRNLHACSDIAFLWADGKMRFKFSDIPFKPFPRQKKTRKTACYYFEGALNANENRFRMGF
jgi:hypothetical protein